MKKVLLTLLCCSIVAVSLSGCGRKDESSSHNMKNKKNHQQKKHEMKKNGKGRDMVERKY